jgi:hypothetical protein
MKSLRSGILVRMARDDICEPVTETSWSSIYGCMWAIDTDTFLGESQEGILLGIAQGEGFEGAEYDGI